MVNILYFGTNRQLLDIITHIPGRQVTAFETEIETINLIRSCAERKEHVVVMMAIDENMMSKVRFHMGMR